MTLTRTVLVAAVIAVAATGCAVPEHPVDGTVVKKVYAPECTTTEIMGTASGPLAYDDVHTEEWFVVVRNTDGTRSQVLLSRDEWDDTAIGDTYTAPDHVWPYQPRRECEENFDVES